MGRVVVACAVLLTGLGVTCSTSQPQTPAASKKSVPGYEAARHLLDAGYPDAAASAVVEMAKASPEVPVPPDLRNIGNSLLEQVRQVVSDWGLVVLLAIAVFLAVVVLPFRLYGRLRKPAQLAIQPVGDSDAARVAAAQLVSCLPGNEATGSRRRPIETITAPIQPVDIPAELTDVLPQTKWLLAAMKLVPRRRMTLSLAMLPATSTTGVGVSLALFDYKARPVASDDLRTDAYSTSASRSSPLTKEEPHDYSRLIGPSASWVVYNLSMAPGANLALDIRTLFFGATRWQSAALFEAGLAAQREHQLAEARYLYQAAYSADPGNRAAATNLAMLEAQDLERYEEAAARLREVRAQTERDPIVIKTASASNGPRASWDDSWYRVCYSLSVCSYHAWQKRGRHNGKRELRDAIESASVVVRTGWSCLKTLSDRGSLSRVEKDFFESVRDVVGATLVLLAGLLISSAESPPAWTPPQIDAVLAEKLREEAPWRSRLPDLTPETVMALVPQMFSPNPIPSRIRYNRACFLSTLAMYADGDATRRLLDAALADLDVGIESRRRADWARKDPSLAKVRKSREKEFNALLERHGSLPPSEPTPSAREKILAWVCHRR